MVCLLAILLLLQRLSDIILAEWALSGALEPLVHAWSMEHVSAG